MDLQSSPDVITIVVAPWTAAFLNCVRNSWAKWSTETMRTSREIGTPVWSHIRAAPILRLDERSRYSGGLLFETPRRRRRRFPRNRGYLYAEPDRRFSSTFCPSKFPFYKQRHF